MLASRGTRKTNGNEAKVEDPAEASALREQGKAVYAKAIGLAILATVVVYLVP